MCVCSGVTGTQGPVRWAGKLDGLGTRKLNSVTFDFFALRLLFSVSEQFKLRKSI